MKTYSFSTVLDFLKAGHKIRRLDWSYAPSAYLQLLPCNSEKFIYIHNKYLGSTVMEGYGLQFADIESMSWVIVD